MTVYPRKYNKQEFLVYLELNKVNRNIIDKFNRLPETIEYNDVIFKLDINSIWYGKDNTYFIFELNYYSEELVEYLFNLKVFNDVEISINYLLCELVDKKHLETII